MRDQERWRRAMEPAPADPNARAIEAHRTLAGFVLATMAGRRGLTAPERSLPLTVTGGFLGSGKTTLLNHLLTEPQGRRIVVLVNDFGSINIDAALIEERTDDMIGLTNGCACCAVSSDPTKSLIEIAKRPVRPDAIVLETSGVANPGTIAQIALANRSVRLDGIITVVDAETVADRATDPVARDMFQAQIASADLVLLSKLDLLAAAGQDAARSWLAAHFPSKPLLEASQGRVPADVALGIGTARDWAKSDGAVPPSEGHGFDAVALHSERPMQEARVKAFLASLPDRVLRAKGVFDLAERPDARVVFQRVGPRWSREDGTPRDATSPGSSLVVIAPKGTPVRDELQAAFRDCASAVPA